MLTGHDVMHSASAYALFYISMEESDLSERFFTFFFVFYLAPGQGVSRLCGFCGLLLLLLLFFCYADFEEYFVVCFTMIPFIRFL